MIRSAQTRLWIVSFTVRDIDELKPSLTEALAEGLQIRWIMEDKPEKDGSSMREKTFWLGRH